MISPGRTLAVSRLAVVDGLRRHALKGLVALAIAAELGGLLFFDFIPRDIGRASADFILSMAWIAGIVFIFFHGVNTLAWSEEKRVIYTVLARPISRDEYVIGAFAGLAALLLLLNAILAFLGYGTLLLIKGSVRSVYFPVLSTSGYLLAWLGLFAAELMLLSALVLFSGLVRGAFPVLLMGIAFYGIASGLPVVRIATALRVQDEKTYAWISEVLRVLAAVFPDFGRLDFKDFIGVQAVFQEDLTGFLVALGLAVAYVTVLLLAACAVYRKRDLL